MSDDQTPSRRRPVRRLTGDQAETVQDQLAAEQPLEIRLGDQPLAVTMRTPGADEDLAAGFCITEAVVTDPDEIERIEPCTLADGGNVVIVHLADEAETRGRTRHAERRSYLSSSCGLCGRESIDRVRQALPAPITGDFTVTQAVLSEIPATLREHQPTFDATGGLHAAGFFAPDGRLLIGREDVGRHNAVDKVIGAAALSGRLPLSEGVLLVSGRASFEIMQKAAMAGIAAVAAVSAPSSLAVDFAAETDMTLVGFLRENRMNVYHDPGRVSG
ncbi:MAG: formate dehydrogenase accessory sulfurtransferase FdhD [Phycisphaeraceae bacterium]|nr:formate dehydrogenase accessory sulfurtransferase FdhD [Phycisphaeraceae bacterium]